MRASPHRPLNPRGVDRWDEGRQYACPRGEDRPLRRCLGLDLRSRQKIRYRGWESVAGRIPKLRPPAASIASTAAHAGKAHGALRMGP